MKISRTGGRQIRHKLIRIPFGQFVHDVCRRFKQPLKTRRFAFSEHAAFYAAQLRTTGFRCLPSASKITSSTTRLANKKDLR